MRHGVSRRIFCDPPWRSVSVVQKTAPLQVNPAKSQKHKMSTVRSYLSLVKFSHTIFALPFALIGFFLGRATVQRWMKDLLGPFQETRAWINVYSDHLPKPLWQVFLLVILCMVFARSAAM